MAKITYIFHNSLLVKSIVSQFYRSSVKVFMLKIDLKFFRCWHLHLKTVGIM